MGAKEGIGQLSSPRRMVRRPEQIARAGRATGGSGASGARLGADRHADRADGTT